MKFDGAYLYTWVGRSTVIVNCLAREHNAMSLARVPFLETATETFRARKAIFSSSVSKTGQVYTPETSCMKENTFILRICE